MQSGATLRGPTASRVETGTNARPASRQLGLLDYATLGAIGLVVVLVSLPRLRAFALRENERDAVNMLRVLASDSQRHGEVLRAGGLGALLAVNNGHRVRLEDLELVDQGRLRRHGYLFDARETEPGHWLLRAWPWEHAHTGLGAFLVSPGGAVHGCANLDGGISGPGAPPPEWLDPGAHGWVRMPEE